MSKFTKLTNDELESLFFPGHWGELSRESHLEVMQEMENRMAGRQKRTPREVVYYRDEEEKASNGYWSAQDCKIHMNDLLVNKGKRWRSECKPELCWVDYPGLSVYATLLHEGVHAWQYEAINGIRPGMSDMGLDYEAMREIYINSARYRGVNNYIQAHEGKEFYLYLMQPVEAQANKYGYSETLNMIDRHPSEQNYKYIRRHFEVKRELCSKERSQSIAKAALGDDIVERQDKWMLDRAISIEAHKKAEMGEKYVECQYFTGEEKRKVEAECRALLVSRADELHSYDQDTVQIEAHAAAQETEHTETLDTAKEAAQTETHSAAEIAQQTEAHAAAQETEYKETRGTAKEAVQTETHSAAEIAEQTEAHAATQEAEYKETRGTAKEAVPTETHSAAKIAEQTEAHAAAQEAERTETLDTAKEAVPVEAHAATQEKPKSGYQRPASGHGAAQKTSKDSGRRR